MKIISHRGGAKLAPENSIEAINVSKLLGVDGIEIDVRLTKDSKLIVFHDHSLKRLAGVNKSIKNLSLNEINKIRLKNGTKIPTLEESIDAVGNLPLLIEGKEAGWAKVLNNLLQTNSNKGNFTVISFNDSELQKFKMLSPTIDCYYTTFFNGFKAVKVAKRNNYEGINIHFWGLNPLVYQLAKKNNLKISLFTLNSRIIFKLLNHFYPDVGVITNRPDRFIKLVKPIEE